MLLLLLLQMRPGELLPICSDILDHQLLNPGRKVEIDSGKTISGGMEEASVFVRPDWAEGAIGLAGTTGKAGSWLRAPESPGLMGGGWPKAGNKSWVLSEDSKMAAHNLIWESYNGCCKLLKARGNTPTAARGGLGPGPGPRTRLSVP